MSDDLDEFGLREHERYSTSGKPINSELRVFDWYEHTLHDTRIKKSNETIIALKERHLLRSITVPEPAKSCAGWVFPGSNSVYFNMSKCDCGRRQSRE